jgi:Na+-translocating ferredoxin:NAD+ oxidoreductase RnfG subunit
MMFLTTLLLGLAQTVATPSLTPAEALALAFPDCKVERIMHSLDKKQLAKAKKLAGEKTGRSSVRAYRASKDGKLVGTAYFDQHKVRSKAQLLMVALDGANKISRVELLRFDEPPEYRPRAKWFAKFRGKKLDAALKLKAGIPNLTGATLSARASLSAVRRLLAVHQVLYPLPKKSARAKDRANSPVTSKPKVVIERSSRPEVVSKTKG